MFEHLTKLRQERTHARRSYIVREYLLGMVVCMALVTGVAAAVYYRQHTVMHIVHANVTAVSGESPRLTASTLKPSVLQKTNLVIDKKTMQGVIVANKANQGIDKDHSSTAVSTAPTRNEVPISALPPERYTVYGKAKELGIKAVGREGVEGLNGHILRRGDTFPNGEQILSINAQIGRIETQLRTIQIIE